LPLLFGDAARRINDAQSVLGDDGVVLVEHGGPAQTIVPGFTTPFFGTMMMPLRM
jgi:hypothetical protein